MGETAFSAPYTNENTKLSHRIMESEKSYQVQRYHQGDSRYFLSPGILKNAINTINKEQYRNDGKDQCHNCLFLIVDV